MNKINVTRGRLPEDRKFLEGKEDIGCPRYRVLLPLDVNKTRAADEVANSAEAMLTLTATSSESSLQRVLKVLTDSGTSCTTKRASPSSCRLIDDGHGRKKKRRTSMDYDEYVA
uniref:Uncharacterized protein n=1 Tax=Vespula pensylvanica TaxID=30213 RepID=A0A834JU74_VESPE|nr:hypothetical protein H0235_017042 [Vespula pensylvanica]